MTRTRACIARRRARNRASAVSKLDRPAPLRPPAPAPRTGLIFFVVLLALILGLWLWL